MIGVNERCLRDNKGRIIFWEAGYSREEWEDLKKKYPGCYESVGIEIGNTIR